MSPNRTTGTVRHQGEPMTLREIVCCRPGGARVGSVAKVTRGSEPGATMNHSLDRIGRGGRNGQMLASRSTCGQAIMDTTRESGKRACDLGKY